MPATMEERLDELLGMAREVGHLETEATRLDRHADSVQSWERSKARRHARDARKAAERAVTSLAKSRASFLAALPAEGEAS